jgi:hypothetical protein
MEKMKEYACNVTLGHVQVIILAKKGLNSTLSEFVPVDLIIQ